MKKMNIKEFREKGYLQEVNRLFFHKLGLALEVDIDDDGNEIISGIQDSREDPEGFIYDLENSDNARVKNFKEKAKFIKEQFDYFKKHRIANLGFNTEPIPGLKEGDLENED